MQSPLPENEPGRVEALRSYRILDTPPDERFDDLARLAAYVCRICQSSGFLAAWATTYNFLGNVAIALEASALRNRFRCN